jgi:hypothetical protein
MRSDIVPGAVFPDYELPDHTKTVRRLSELGRPSVEEPRHDLRSVTREIRPDWDLSTPGLREAWDAGDRAPFHGWNRWSPERFAAELERLGAERVLVPTTPGR